MSNKPKSPEHSDAKVPPRRKRFRRTRRVLRWGFGFLALFGIFVSIQMWRPMGKSPTGERLARMQESPNWNDGVFVNPVPARMSMFSAAKEAWLEASDYTKPSTPIPVVQIDPARFETPPASGLRITWFGHSTMMIEIEGHRFLTDPVWGQRASPLTWMGPKRFYPPLMKLSDMPQVDAVLISHDHYDHLDYPTFKQIKDWDTKFIVPLGVGAHLEYWGVAKDKIIEQDWWDTHRFGNVEVVSTPSRHFSGRGIFDRSETQWCGYALKGPTRRAFFSGDTSMFPGFKEIGDRLGPFDITMLDSGAYAKTWADVHLGPEQAIEAHQMLRGRVFMPVHWGLFTLAPHGWTEPIERTSAAAKKGGVKIVTPRPGGSFEPTNALENERWWPDVPWRTEKQYPVRSSK